LCPHLPPSPAPPTPSLHAALPISGQFHHLHSGDGLEQRARFVPHALRIGQVAGVMIGDALPATGIARRFPEPELDEVRADIHDPDRKSTRLNSSHVKISYAVFCLK